MSKHLSKPKVDENSKTITLSQTDLNGFKAVLDSLGGDVQMAAMRYGIACQVFGKVLGQDFDALAELDELEKIALKLKRKIERERELQGLAA